MATDAPYDDRWEVKECWRMEDRSTGAWDEALLEDGRGAWLKLLLHRSRRGLWMWEWHESYLGLTTALRSAIAFRSRNGCLDSLMYALVSTGFSELVDAILQWEGNSNG